MDKDSNKSTSVFLTATNQENISLCESHWLSLQHISVDYHYIENIFPVEHHITSMLSLEQ